MSVTWFIDKCILGECYMLTILLHFAFINVKKFQKKTKFQTKNIDKTCLMKEKGLPLKGIVINC